MAQVVARQGELAALNAGVVTVSFGTPYWSRVWLAETGSPFPFLVDEPRAAYAAYGLRHSRWRSWSLRNILYYARARRQGRAPLGDRGDAHQLGGDFVVDRRGSVRLAHPSAEPTDRPVWTAIVRALAGD